MRRVNRWIILAVLAVFLLAGSALGADVAKIGVVEFQRLFENSDAGKEIKAKITTQGKKMEAELKEKGAEIEELKKRLEREALVMSKEMREEKGTRIQNQGQRYQNPAEEIRGQLQGIQKN
jgi:outer membrane protein